MELVTYWLAYLAFGPTVQPYNNLAFKPHKSFLNKLLS